MKRLSFIVPAYNAEGVLTKCIKSILNWEGDDLELIIVNDGSTDGTSKLVKSYNDSRIIYFEQENKGVSEARNLGLSNATGKYIAFIDADDFVDVDKYISLLDGMDENYDFIMFSYDMLFPDRKVILACILPEGVYTSKEGIDLCERLYDEPFSKNYKSKYIGGKVYQYIYKKEFLVKYNIKFIPGIHFAEDCLFCLTCFKHVQSFAVSTEIMYHYLVLDSSASHKYRVNLWQEQVEAYERGSEIFGGEFAHKNETYFHYGNGVVHRAVSYGLKYKKKQEALKAIEKMLNTSEFQTAIHSVTFQRWTIRERIFLELYRKKRYRLTYLTHITIIILKKLFH